MSKSYTNPDPAPFAATANSRDFMDEPADPDPELILILNSIMIIINSITFNYDSKLESEGQIPAVV